jgi:hypothetical protein
MTMSTGTIGSMPCEISLNAILIEVADPKVTNYVTHKYESLRYGLKKLKPLAVDHAFYSRMCDLWRDHIVLQIAEKYKSGFLSEVVYRHLHCCVVAQHRTALKFKPEKQDETDRHTD